MFKPVTGSDLNNFDEETRSLYAKRESDWRYTDSLLRSPRPSRNYLPIVADPEHPFKKEKEAFVKSAPFKMLAFTLTFSWAQYQFSKAYYPYGIILRKSIPTTPALQFSYKAPILAIFACAWYI